MNRHASPPAALWLPAVVLVLLLGACANTGKRSLYHWGGFPDVSYSWLKDNAADDSDSLAVMEKDLQTAIANDHDLPPGFHAHLGLLYLKAGQTDQAISHWEAEKTAFPESSPFMDFQLQSLHGPKPDPEPDAKTQSRSEPELHDENSDELQEHVQ